MRVMPSGSRQWVVRIAVRGRRCDYGVGGYPLVTLKDARDMAFAYRKLARAGGDPAALRAERAVPTFREMAEAVIKTQRMSWRDDRTEKLWRSRLTTYAMPRLGRMTVNAITAADVVSVLLSVWVDKPETGKRLRRIISAIMQAAVVAGHRLDDPAGPALTAALPKPGRKPAKHYTALPHGQLGEALAKVRAVEDVWIGARLCFEFCALLACRSGEARAATWSEFDLEARVWAVPATRTKMAKELRVPLSDGVMRVLSEARALGDDLLFPARRGGALRDSTLAKLPRELGIGTTHGLRSSFRSWCSDEGIDHAAAELALGHAIGNATVAAYARSDMLEARRPIMQKWCDYIEHQRTG